MTTWEAAPTPRGLGLPKKFSEFREIQLHAISRIMASKKPYVMLQGPTGSGKTLIAAAIQKALNEPMLYICFTKQLQEQFCDDFSVDYYGFEYAVQLKGRTNYPTLRYPHLFPKVNAASCTKDKEDHCRWCCDGKCNHEVGLYADTKCQKIQECPYRAQKRRALMAKMAVLNFDIFVNEANYIGGFSRKFPIVCVDEADLIEHGLMSFVQFEITRRWIDRFGLPLPDKKTVEESWTRWARDVARPMIMEELIVLQNEYGIDDMRREQELKRMLSKMNRFIKEVTSSERGRWVFLAEEDKWTWKPVFISRFAHDNLWQHGDKFLLMSATLISPDEVARNLGIPRADVDFIDLPSLFPKERRPIYYTPAAAVSKKNEYKSRAKVITALDGLLDKYPDSKVLCHCTSYGYAKQVVESSKHKRRLLTYMAAQDRATALQHFKSSNKPLVLVASSMDRGVDLPYDQCRVVIVLKIPFLNLGDKQVSQRLYSDRKGGRLWYTVNTIRSLVQETGRGMRSEDDSCDSYILDSQFERLYSENRGLFPQWWRSALHIHK